MNRSMYSIIKRCFDLNYREGRVVVIARLLEKSLRAFGLFGGG